MSMSHIITAAVAAAVAFGAMALASPEASADTFDQKDFPCQEDEVLGYAPKFGPDRVGCINIDELTS